MGIFILIIILGGVISGAGIAVVQQEFSSFDNCEVARKHIVATLPKEVPWGQVLSQGCFKKDLPSGRNYVQPEKPKEKQQRGGGGSSTPTYPAPGIMGVF